MKTFSLTAALALSLGLAACTASVPQLRYQAQERVTVKDWTGGLKKYDEVLAKSPDDWEANLGRGRCLLKLNQPQPAETSLRRALAILGPQAPLAPAIRDDIANAKTAQNDQAGFVEFAAEQVKRTGTSRDFVRQARGLAFFGDVDGAVSSFRKAEIRAFDENTDNRFAVYLSEADFYAQMRDQPNALRYTRYAAHVNHTHPDIAPRLSRLGRVPGPTEWMTPPPSKEELLKTEKGEFVETK